VGPAIGARVLMPLSVAWPLIGYTDIGGFGVGSDLTYQLLAGVNWEFTEGVMAKAGCRYHYQDFDDDGFAWDMVSDGAYAGIGFQF
jgi:opacity protein-like surface antigen